jgi:hypothetical protein
MKKLLIVLMLAAPAFAGPVRILTYPVFHSVKTARAIGHAGRAVGIAVKDFVW